MNYITMERDRYSGAYSRAEYTAWGGPAPEEISDGDSTCEYFWDKIHSGELDSDGKPVLYGDGATFDEALKSFFEKFIERVQYNPAMWGVVYLDNAYVGARKAINVYYVIGSDYFNKSFPLTYEFLKTQDWYSEWVY